ncbi:MAG TPA: phage terminase large subunit [Verrucomicrobiae bacterium]|jgi:predicted phage terminase large subunit-like protein|nr:phage terminase large subunit [Verrucomicrobiae bacterium]
MNLNLEAYEKILRTDFIAFMQRAFYDLNPETEYSHNWHIACIAEALEKCRTGQLRRLVINVPPRSLKSHLASIAFPAFVLGHNPTSQIICLSYAQDLSSKLAKDGRTVMCAPWYLNLFPGTRLASSREAVNDFFTTRRGFRFATSISGVMTGRGADFIIIDDPLRPEEALSETQREAVNACFEHTVISRLNDKTRGCIILIMQRLHEDDLTGHVLKQGGWHVLKFPAIAEEDEVHTVQTLFGPKVFRRRRGEALHPEREPLDVLASIREVQGEYTFAGQYQQEPAPLGGGLIKAGWFMLYSDADRLSKFDLIVQSWDTANKPSELADYSVCTTWGVKEKHLYLLHVYRKRVDYPELKRAVREQAEAFGAKTVLIENRASGTQLIQELVSEGMQAVQRYEPEMNKIMRMNSVTSTIENGFAHLPQRAEWLPEYLHELEIFPFGNYDDQVDSTSQILDWFKNKFRNQELGLIEYYKKMANAPELETVALGIPKPRQCPECKGSVHQIIANGLKCEQCEYQWADPRLQPEIPNFNRKDILNGRVQYRRSFRRF